MVTHRIPINKNWPLSSFAIYNNQVLLPRNDISFINTSFLDERTLHQKSHADVLSSSFDEYSTDKPKDNHEMGKKNNNTHTHTHTLEHLMAKPE